MFLKSFAHAAGLAAVVAMGAPAAQAAIYTLDFDRMAACAGNCGNGSAISQTYGDVAGVVDVQYDGDHTTAVVTQMAWWDDSYNDLRGVAYGGTNEIFLKPLDGKGITLLGFDIGAWANTTRQSQVSVLDGAGNVLFATGPTTIGIFPGNLHNDFDGPWTSLDGIRIRFGPDGFNVGIDNIRFETGVIPEPSTYALLGAGLLGVGATLRRRSRRIAA